MVQLLQPSGFTQSLKMRSEEGFPNKSFAVKYSKC